MDWRIPASLSTIGLEKIARNQAKTNSERITDSAAQLPELN